MLVDHSAGVPIRMTVMDVENMLIPTTGDSVSVTMDMQAMVVLFTIAMLIILVTATTLAMVAVMDQRYMTVLIVVTMPSWMLMDTVHASMATMETTVTRHTPTCMTMVLVQSLTSTTTMDTWEITSTMVDIMETVIQLVMAVVVLMLMIVQAVATMLTLIADTAVVTMAGMAMIVLCHMQLELLTGMAIVIWHVALIATALSPMTVMDVELTHMSTTGASAHVIQDTLAYIVPEIILM